MEPVGAVSPGYAMVVIVDDEPDIAREIADGLAADGIPTLVAGSAEEAIRLLERETGRIGVVVTDLRMPGIDGIGLIQRLRQGPPSQARPEIVLMSGHASPAEWRAAQQAGAAALLSKPFAWDDLSKAVGAALEAARRQDAVPPAPAAPPDAD